MMAELETGISLETRRRLLDAAGEVFAEKGFANATVREICQKAKANIAAVNYHFGDKEKLYAAVFVDSHPKAGDLFNPGELAGLPPEDRLKVFVRNFMKHLLDPGRPSCHGRLMAREMSEPTGVLEAFVENEVRPRVAMLQEIIRDLAGDLPPRVIAKCSMSVVGQMLHYHHARAVTKRISPIYADLDQHVEELVDQITRFSLGGIRAIADRYQKGSP
jgi:TetR/AcrR family transcriptional regulator, regulator of cefoperazone and chloramphenicol sensitivity